eukprot:9482096-Pyramimonas_sp.AAC.1
MGELAQVGAEYRALAQPRRAALNYKSADAEANTLGHTQPHRLPAGTEELLGFLRRCPDTRAPNPG